MQMTSASPPSLPRLSVALSRARRMRMRKRVHVRETTFSQMYFINGRLTWCRSSRRRLYTDRWTDAVAIESAAIELASRAVTWSTMNVFIRYRQVRGK